MATTPVEFTCVSGLTLTAELYPFGSDTIGNTGGDSATEATNRKGLYSFDVTEALAGWYTAIIKEGTEIRAVYEVYMVDDTNIHRCHEHADLQYEDGAIWLDTVNGASGTTTFLNGTPTNPVSTIADALTLATALKISRIHVAPGSSITLAATVANLELYGVNWTLALGSQAITGSRFIGATVSGTGTTSGAAPTFEKCIMGASTLPPSYFYNCQFSGTLTMGSTGAFIMYDCHAHKAPAAGVQITFTSNATLRMSNCYGYFQAASAASGNILEWNGVGKLQIKATCSDLIATLAGSVELQDLGTNSAVTLTANWTTDNVVNYTGYEEGAVWVDTVLGAPGTASYFNGTASLPVDSIADALQIASQLGISKIHIATGNSITLAASLVNYELYGVNWTLALGSQDISGSCIKGATVSGTATAPTDQPTFDNCLLTTVTLPGCYVLNSRMYGAFTMGSTSTTYTLNNCIHGFTTPATDVNFTFAANSVLKMSDCVGYFGFASAASGNILEWHGGSGHAHIRNTCNSLTAYLSGTIDLLDEGTSSTITDESRYNTSQQVGDVSGKVLGGGSSEITDVGAWVLNNTGLPIGSGGSPVGPGSTEVVITTVDDDNNPVDGVAVWISTDEAGTDVIAGTLYSAGNGRAKFMLDTDMVYWVWRELSGFNFSPNPEMITLGTP